MFSRKVWVKENAGRYKKQRKDWKKHNPEAVLRHRVTAKDKRAVYMKEYHKNNRTLLNAAAARRRAAVLQRTPKWLTSAQLQQIKDFYINCPVGMVVDHIIPLQGKYISGLHHPDNLQYLTKSENCKKGNKYLTTCPYDHQ
ncbi:hypothetical protein LCGC14_1581670 [marine sediment metagenome]|uniref:HNH nuclease domain-containing protein n=1 Tax=marine sediment metagenome TaxID=412755 RepID=A0A0F9J2T3_9ZZZZ